MRKKVRRKIAAFIILIGGVLASAYPLVSNYIFEHRADSLVYTYEKAAEELHDSEVEELYALAQEYNNTLSSNTVRFSDPFGERFGLTDIDEDAKDFANQLSFDRTGVIGSVEIPKIGVKLPIYAKESYDQALERGTALVSGTSIPVGGEGTHAAISGHTGLDTAKIFTDLISVEAGDLFFISILGETLAYEVEEIFIVEPHDFSKLKIESDKDLCTLITCTPYGVNTHRLLVRGVRTEYEPEIVEQMRSEDNQEESQWFEQYMTALGVGGLIILGIVCLLFIERGNSKIISKGKDWM